jgi:hypothetical protein
VKLLSTLPLFRSPIQEVWTLLPAPAVALDMAMGTIVTMFVRLRKVFGIWWKETVHATQLPRLVLHLTPLWRFTMGKVVIACRALRNPSTGTIFPGRLKMARHIISW